jgi:glycine oxidase
VLAEDEMDQARELMAFSRDRGCSWEWVEAPELRRLEPHISESALGGVFFSGDHRVDPELLAAALLQSAESRGLQVSFGSRLTGFDAIGDQEVEVRLQGRSGAESCAADLVVLAAGSWSAQLGELAGLNPRVRPVRGQQCRFRGGQEIHHVLRHGGFCAVPYRDQIVAGATLEDVGFAADTTPAAATEITGFFRRILQLAPVVVEQRAGLRPKPRRGRPVIGPLGDGLERVFLATGHYKSGVLLGPITGQVVAEWLLTGEPPRQMGPFTVAR